jgi:signal peptidase II
VPPPSGNDAAPVTSFRKYGVPALSALLLAALDQGTKAWVVRTLPVLRPLEIASGWVDLVHVRNTGVAFSLLANLDPGWVRPLLLLATVLAMAAVVAYIWLLPAGGTTPWGLGLILGGAAGNLIDRARLGYVVDFIDVHWRGHHWPTFNVADVGITVGVALLLADMIFGDKGADTPPPAEERKS